MTTLTIEIPEKVEKTLSDLVEQLGGKVLTKNSGEDSYAPEFVVKIKKSMKQADEGKVVKIDLDDIWK